MDESVRDLTTAIASGDTEAFARFFRARFDELYGYARQATGRDESFCLDVVQDAMLRVIRSVKPTDCQARLRAWLRIVVQTCACDRLRQEARRRRKEEAAAGARRTEQHQDDLDERLEWLRGEFSKVDGAQTQLLVMRYRLGWTLQRIGRVLSLKPGAVDGRLGRLVAMLRRRAQENFHD